MTGSGRSPGSRIAAVVRLPKPACSSPSLSGILDNGSPLTVAGAASELPWGRRYATYPNPRLHRIPYYAGSRQHLYRVHNQASTACHVNATMPQNLPCTDFPKLRCKRETAAVPVRCRSLLLIVAAAIQLGACTFGNTEGNGYLSFGGQDEAAQSFPQNYRPELLSFLKTYLNDPTNVKAAQIAEPVEKSVGGHQRYVSCLRYSAKEFNGTYDPVKDRGVLYVNGRLDHIIEQPGDLCAGANYAAFPELEKLTR